MKATRLVFPRPRKVEITEEDLPVPGPSDVLVESVCSLMSTGTENTIFNQLFVPGTHWANYGRFPHYPGYCTVGVVRETGNAVDRVAVGDTVVAARPHASHHVADQAEFYAVPEGVAPEEAAWFAIGRITYSGVRNAEIRLGDRVAVVGLGPIGQMIVRWAVASGAEEVVAIDRDDFRLDLARRGGATHLLRGTAIEAGGHLAELLGQLPTVVVDATGIASVLAECLPLVASQGRMLLIGDAGDPSEQRLTGDVLTRGVRIVGGHFNHRYPDRDPDGVYRLFFRMVQTQRICLDGMITHRFSGDQAAEAYALVNQRRSETLGVLFDWQS